MIHVSMSHNISAIWLQRPPDLGARIQGCIDAACDRSENKGPAYIFFRADDVAVPSRRFLQLMELFWRYRVPLCLAVVPARLTGLRWNYLQKAGKKNTSLWCWHQHGWRHLNHEKKGKKQEFGAARTVSEIQKDLMRGKQRLEALMGENFYPVFTPPWNRCSSDTLRMLPTLDYVAVSRSRHSRPRSPAGLPDFSVNVDLHTRKDRGPVSGWDQLLAELEQAIVSGRCGILIHHQMMNDVAFDFLERLLKSLINNKNLQAVHFKDLVAAKIFGDRAT